MDTTTIEESVFESMVADYNNSLYVNELLNKYLDGDENSLEKYSTEWRKAIKKRQAWLDEKIYPHERSFEKAYPRETMICNKQVGFTAFVSGDFSNYQMRKDTIGEVEIYYSLEANDESKYIGFYLLLSLYGYSDLRHAFAIAKSDNGCEDFFPVNMDFKNLTITNQLLTVKIEKLQDFTEIISLCEEAITSINEKIGKKLIKNY